MATLPQFTVKDAIAIRDDIRRTIKNGLIQQGIITNPDVGPNTDYFVIATALGNELAVVGANTIIKADQQMPDSATGDDLTRHGDLLDLEKQPAAGSVGNVLITASATSPIETGRELTDDAGLRFEVLVGGNYDDGDSVPIGAIDTGDATNHAAGDTLQWVSAPPFCDPNVEVDTGGLTNGIDEEDDEVFRSRILAVYQNPPGAGNWEHIAEIGEASTSSVQKIFVHPAHQGPATTGVVAVAAPTETSKSRVIATTTMNGTVIPYIKGKLPTRVGLNITTVADSSVDVAIGLSLPEAPTASPPGLGGGWLDGTPWPAPDGLTYFKHAVTAVTSDTQFTVDAQTAPTAGVTRIQWLSPSNWQLYKALVTSYSGSAGAYVITIDTPFTDIDVGAYVWPACQNAQTYVDAVIDAFAKLGPGEKTTNASALIRGFRHPIPATAWPYSLGAAMLRAVTDTGTEVGAAQFLYRTDGTTTLNGSGGVLTPQVPSNLEDPTNIFTPRNVAFFRIA